MKDKKIVTLITTIVFCFCLIEGVTAERTLTDISEGTWYTNAVKYCQGKGYVGGYPDGSFRPNQPVTRAEIATILCTHATVNGIKLPDTGAEFSAFKDANSGGLHEWNHEPVHWAVSRGIIAGYEDRTIRLNAYVTREQIAVMLSNYFDVQKKAGRTGYVDEKEIGAWALSSVKGMTDSKHMIGVGNRKFCPKQHVTRAQVCQIIMSFAEIIYEEGIPAHASSNCMLKCVTPGVWERTDVKLVVVKQKGNIESTGEPVINDRIEKVPSLEEENQIVADIEKEAQQYPVYREKLADPVKGMIATYNNRGELEEIYIPNGDGTYYIPERTFVKIS